LSLRSYLSALVRGHSFFPFSFSLLYLAVPNKSLLALVGCGEEIKYHIMYDNIKKDKILTDISKTAE
jgi:hypothetical protein